jgi:hypothetical protein
MTVPPVSAGVEARGRQKTVKRWSRTKPDGGMPPSSARDRASVEDPPTAASAGMPASSASCTSSKLTRLIVCAQGSRAN